MLVLDGVTRRFGDLTAVSDIELAIAPGGFIGIIGRSGAGKSTLLRLINRLIDPSGGRILNGTTDVTALRGDPVHRLEPGQDVRAEAQQPRDIT